jgi:hypothetical protein
MRYWGEDHLLWSNNVFNVIGVLEDFGTGFPGDAMAGPHNEQAMKDAITTKMTKIHKQKTISKSNMDVRIQKQITNREIQEI